MTETVVQFLTVIVNGKLFIAKAPYRAYRCHYLNIEEEIGEEEIDAIRLLTEVGLIGKRYKADY